MQHAALVRQLQVLPKENRSLISNTRKGLSADHGAAGGYAKRLHHTLSIGSPTARISRLTMSRRCGWWTPKECGCAKWSMQPRGISSELSSGCTPTCHRMGGRLRTPPANTGPSLRQRSGVSPGRHAASTCLRSPRWRWMGRWPGGLPPIANTTTCRRGRPMAAGSRICRRLELTRIGSGRTGISGFSRCRGTTLSLKYLSEIAHSPTSNRSGRRMGRAWRCWLAKEMERTLSATKWWPGSRASSLSRLTDLDSTPSQEM